METSKGFICPICGKAYDKPRSLHGHMLKAHVEEYRAEGCKLSAYGILYGGSNVKKDPFLKEESKKVSKEVGAPDGLRLLSKTDKYESMARQEGYLFILNDDVFTYEDVKEKGWV